VCKNKQSAAGAGAMSESCCNKTDDDALVLVSAEILRLAQALARAHRAEQARKLWSSRLH